jgi:hypothetical protein
VKTDGLRSRYSPEIVRIAAIQDDSSTNDFREGRCFISSAYTFASFDKKTCLQGDGKRLNILLMGDSHAAHLWSGLQRRYPNINFLQATASGCKPVISRPADAAARCEQMMRFLFDQYLPSHPVDWVILSGSWDPIDALDVAKTLDWLRDRRFHVVLAGPIVRYNAPLPQVLAIALSRHDPALVARVRQPGGSALDVAFHKLAVEHGALYFSPYGALCRSGVCRVTDESGMPLQFDYGHLTAQGSFAVAAAFPMPKELKLSPVVPPIVNR